MSFLLAHKLLLTEYELNALVDYRCVGIGDVLSRTYTCDPRLLELRGDYRAYC